MMFDSLLGLNFQYLQHLHSSQGQRQFSWTSSYVLVPHHITLSINNLSTANTSSCFVEFSELGIFANNGVTSVAVIPH